MAERLELSGTSYWNGRHLGETRMRTETVASIVAVLRRAEAIPSPPPDFRLAGGDTLIVIGTREGVEAAAAILGREPLGTRLTAVVRRRRAATPPEAEGGTGAGGARTGGLRVCAGMRACGHERLRGLLPTPA